MTSRIEWMTARLTGQDIHGEIRSMIGQVYRYPLMFGATAEEVDVVLWAYHDLIGRLAGRGEDYRDLLRSSMRRAGCSSLLFAGHCRRHVHGGRRASEAQVAGCVIEHWKQIDGLMGLEIPAPGGRP